MASHRFLQIEVLAGITIDHELKFDDYPNYLCKNPGQKLNALTRIAPFLGVWKKLIIIKSFMFWYCPLIWMFHSRGINNKIDHTHERALTITYNNNLSPYAKLLTKDSSVTINHRALAMEIFKVILRISHLTLHEVLHQVNNILIIMGKTF